MRVLKASEPQWLSFTAIINTRGVNPYVDVPQNVSRTLAPYAQAGASATPASAMGS